MSDRVDLAPADQSEAHAIRVWDDTLHALPDSAAWVASARRSLVDAGMVMNGQEAVHVARPILLAAERRDADQGVVEAVTGALAAAADLALADASVSAAYLGDWLTDSPLEPLIRLDPGYAMPIVYGRYDGARVDGSLRILEFNGGLPGGSTPADGVPAVMQSWEPAQALSSHVTLERMSVAASLLGSIGEVWAEFGGTGTPFTVIAAPRELAGSLEGGLRHVAGMAARAGVEVVVADPGELVHQEGRLRLAGRPVDVLVRAFFTSMAVTLGDRVRGIVDALAAGDVCLVTSFRSGLLGHKALFAIVTDPGVELDLPAEQRAAACAALPWTRLLADGRTTDSDGREVDLLAFAESERSRLVLKPTAGYGGQGVTLGWEQEPEQWSAALRSALGTGAWILQERVVLSADEFPELAEGFPLRTYTSDINPIVCSGRVAGYFTRLAAVGGITNMSSGDGSTTGTFLLRPQSG
jgi:hypothetical protein